MHGFKGVGGGGHRWEDMMVLVVDKNPDCTDAERQNKEKFG